MAANIAVICTSENQNIFSMGWTRRANQCMGRERFARRAKSLSSRSRATASPTDRPLSRLPWPQTIAPDGPMLYPDVAWSQLGGTAQMIVDVRTYTLIPRKQAKYL